MRLAVLLFVGCLGCAPAGSAVSKVTHLYSCVRTDGTLTQVHAYAFKCRGSEQLVSWKLDP
jgi:hypothetical protein